jgi:hypothetical protein
MYKSRIWGSISIILFWAFFPHKTTIYSVKAYKRDTFLNTSRHWVRLFLWACTHEQLNTMWSVSWYSAGSGHLEESCIHRTPQDMHVKQNVSSLLSNDFVRLIFSEQDLDIWMNVDQSKIFLQETCTSSAHIQYIYLDVRVQTKHGCMHMMHVCQCALQVASLRSLTRASLK